MTRFARHAFFTFMLLCGVEFAQAKDLYLICHPSVTLELSDARDVYLGDKQVAGSSKLIPVDNAAAQPEFLSKTLQMEPTKYKTVWMKKSFRDGLAIPPVKSGDAEVIAFVRKAPGAVGYVSTPPPDGVKFVGKF